MKKCLVIGLALLSGCVVSAQQKPSPKPKPPAKSATRPEIGAEELRVYKICIDREAELEKAEAAAATTSDEKKPKKSDPNLAPLPLVICEVENALNAYNSREDVDSETRKALPGLASADFDFKAVSDTKISGGIGLFIIKLVGGSYDKQKTNEVVFTYTPKSRAQVRALDGGYPKSFQKELIDLIVATAKMARKEQLEQEKYPPAPGTDPFVLKQTTITVSFGINKGFTLGVSIPVNIVTLGAQLDKTKNNVQSVKLTFADPPKKPATGD
jgi:hypothetical protein